MGVTNKINLMKNKNTFWRIEREEHTKLVSSMILPTGQITTKKIKELMNNLCAKYILDDEEILASLCIKNTKRYNQIIHPISSNQVDKEGLHHPVYFVNHAGIHITISLIYEDDLSSDEKIQINKRSSLKLKN